MKTRLAVAALVAGVLVAANVRAGWQENLQKAEQKANADRLKNKLTSNDARAKFGTPEMLFNRVPEVAPGQKLTVLAQGTFAKDTQFVVERDDVEVVSSGLAANGWQATLQVKPDAWPGAIEVAAVAPVSGIQTNEVAARVRGRYALDVELENGWTAHVQPTSRIEDGNAQATTTWFKKGEKTPFQTRPAQVTYDSEIRVEIPLTDEELGSALDDGQKKVDVITSSGDIEKVGALADEMQKKCGSLPPEKMEACMEPYNAKMQAINDDVDKRTHDFETNAKSTKLHEAFGCTAIAIRRDSGHLEGTAEGCGGRESQAVKSAKLTYVP